MNLGVPEICKKGYILIQQIPGKPYFQNRVGLRPCLCIPRDLKILFGHIAQTHLKVPKANIPTRWLGAWDAYNFFASIFIKVANLRIFWIYFFQNSKIKLKNRVFGTKLNCVSASLMLPQCLWAQILCLGINLHSKQNKMLWNLCLKSV